MGLFGVPHPHRGSSVRHDRVKQSGTNLSHPRSSSSNSSGSSDGVHDGNHDNHHVSHHNSVSHKTQPGKAAKPSKK